jgi:hypothetical protein
MNSGVLLLLLVALVCPVAAQTSAVTGVVDEHPGEQYVVLEEGTMRELALLQPGRMATESFAKYLGHRVTVRGRMEGRSLRVDSIERISQSPGRDEADRMADRHVSEAELHSLTGFVDRERGGRWVLRADGNDRVLAILAGRTDFRQYRGQKVLVEGELRADEPDGAILDVERIELFPPNR